MTFRDLLRSSLCLVLLSACGALFTYSAGAQTPVAPQSFAVEHGQFVLDGKPFRIISGEMHYARVPHPYWRQRLRMAKAMGLNAVTTYVRESGLGHPDYFASSCFSMLTAEFADQSAAPVCCAARVPSLAMRKVAGYWPNCIDGGMSRSSMT
jgi:hypothetical protein